MVKIIDIDNNDRNCVQEQDEIEEFYLKGNEDHHQNFLLICYVI